MKGKMLWKSLVVGVMVLFVGASVIPAIARNVVEKQDDGALNMVFNSGGNVLYVGGSGPGNYSSIQAAVDNASDGDTVFVYGGIYYETVFLNKQIDLIGEDRETTILDGERPWGDAWNNIRIYDTEYVTVSGFSVVNCDLSEGAGIYSSADNVVIYDNVFSNMFQGIELYSAYGVTISDNVIEDNADSGVGIRFSSDNIVVGNTITSNGVAGVSMDRSSGTVISGNIIKDNVGDGVSGSDSHYSIVSGNEIINNKRGIRLSDSSNNSIVENVVSHNSYNGIFLTSGSSYNVITDNRIACNGREGVYLIYGAEYNHVYHNLFLSHLPWNAYGGGAYWYNAVIQEGNYWYDYVEEQGGYDDDGDGIGDVPYHVAAGGYDHYPLMEPWGDNEPPETPVVDGPTSGAAGVEYDYTFLTTDPEGEDVQYYINWGDKKEFWLGPYPSGDIVTIAHVWNMTGDFTVKVKARDFYGLESDWATLEVTMPRNQVVRGVFLNFLQQHPDLSMMLRQMLGL